MSIKTHSGIQSHVKVAPNEQHCWKYVGKFGLARSCEGHGIETHKNISNGPVTNGRACRA